MSKHDAGVEARRGEKMIAVTLYFWTNNIASVKDNILPKQCHSSGIVRVNANKSHGISNDRTYKFRTLGELPNVIEEALDNSGVRRINA